MTQEELAERVRALFDYNPATGVFVRKVRTAQRHQVGDRADFIVTGGGLKGYRRVAFDSKRYLAHRVAWLYVYGTWPSKQVDHLNGDKGDNRLSNLRDVPHQVNGQNLRKAKAENRAGLLGVHQAQGRWYACVSVNGRKVHRSAHPTPEAAHAAYIEAKRRHHEGCTL